MRAGSGAPRCRGDPGAAGSVFSSCPSRGEQAGAAPALQSARWPPEAAAGRGWLPMTPNGCSPPKCRSQSPGLAGPTSPFFLTQRPKQPQSRKARAQGRRRSEGWPREAAPRAPHRAPAAQGGWDPEPRSHPRWEHVGCGLSGRRPTADARRGALPWRADADRPGAAAPRRPAAEEGFLEAGLGLSVGGISVALRGWGPPFGITGANGEGRRGRRRARGTARERCEGKLGRQEGSGRGQPESRRRTQDSTERARPWGWSPGSPGSCEVC